ncbi:MAG: PhzF family phenazine biosynthesis protein [Hyphomicrobiaceae bacterium]
MFQVDAFTDRVFSGNPAAVLLLEHGLADTTMQSIAQENNLAETAFALKRSNGEWDLRWFTPVHEVDFCGHATLATAHVIMTETDAADPLVFHTRVGTLQVTRVDGGYCLDVPRLLPDPIEALPLELDGVFPTSPPRIFKNFENIFADLGGADAVRSFEPDVSRIARLGSIGLAVTGRDTSASRAHFVSRYFVPGAGIPEDPVTGSIHATLVPYWADRIGLTKLTAFQASARGGWLDCELVGDRVKLTGGAVTFMEARLFLP